MTKYIKTNYNQQLHTTKLMEKTGIIFLSGFNLI